MSCIDGVPKELKRLWLVFLELDNIVCLRPTRIAERAGEVLAMVCKETFVNVESPRVFFADNHLYEFAVRGA